MRMLEEKIQAAWRSNNPLALHQVAIQWAAEGRNKAPLYDALERLLLSIREDGASEDAEEKVLGVMDRLTGWGHASNLIRTNGSEPLVETELAILPRWGQVALAARCARRTLPIFRQKWPDASSELLTTLTYATEVGEWLAARGRNGDSNISILGAVACAIYVCDAAYNADRNRERAQQVIRGYR